jgi:hypothetical protein
MANMPKEKMKLYLRNRRKLIRCGEAVCTVAGVLKLVRDLEERVDKLEGKKRVRAVEREL